MGASNRKDGEAQAGDSDPLIGVRIGCYRVVRRLGEGGFGQVHEGIHELIGKRAAIKTLRRELSQNEDTSRRFLNEARAANRIQHPGIVNVFEFGQLPDGTAYMIMEFLDGITLRSRQGLSPGLSLSDVVRLTRQIASPLAAAHAQGIVHRDLKPDNVMIVPDADMPGGERVKVLDFGAAKLKMDPCIEDAHKTRTGMALGTPAYMSPEQCRGEREVDAQSDVYSLGVMLYQMLCGKKPFESTGAGALIAMHIYEKPRPITEVAPDVPAPLAWLVHAMLAKDPEGRPTMAEVTATLDRFAGTISSHFRAVSQPDLAPLPATVQMIVTPHRGAAPVAAAGALVLLLVASMGVAWRVWRGARVPAPAAPVLVRSTPDVPVQAAPVPVEPSSSTTRLEIDSTARWYIQEAQSRAGERFQKEYAATLRQIRTNPRLEPVSDERRPALHRRTLERSQYYLYYEYAPPPADRVVVLLVWPTSSSDPPPL